MDPITRHDLDSAINGLRQDMELGFERLRSEFRQDMVTHVRWLAGLFIVQFIATVGATTGLVSFIISSRLPLQ